MVERNCIAATHAPGSSLANELRMSHIPLKTEKSESDGVQGVLPIVLRNVSTWSFRSDGKGVHEPLKMFLSTIDSGTA